MPRRKGQGVQLQRKPLTVKTPSCIQLKKTALDAKTNDVEEPVKPVHAVEAAEVADFADTSYLHKKFKKVAGVSFTSKTEERPVNGLLSLADGPKPEEELPAVPPGRYVCPYCQLACAKPSVLQKHVRAHTNERPYPCAPCGFAFKTKSNLYKHCRSQSHRVKTGLGEPCDSAGSDLSDDSSQSSADIDDSKPEDSQPRIYKPKFHKAAFYQEEHKLGADESSQSSPDKTKLSSPTSELLQQRISKIIRDNQVIFETMEPQFSKKFLQRQNSREKESSSPKSDLEIKRIHETKSKLALALLKVDRMERSYSPSYPKVNSENHTYQPLNLTKKPTSVSGGSMIKEILIASRDSDARPERMAELLSTLQTQVQSQHLHTSHFQPDPDHDVGPLLGNTPLVDAPSAKKRRVQSTTVPPDPRGLSALSSRRLSTSSLPSTLKSLEELSRHPMKQPSVHMFGGEVKILDCGEPRTVRIASSPEPAEDELVVTVAKTGLHASGGTLLSAGAPAFHMASILSPDTSSLVLAPNVVTPNLTVPGAPPPEVGVLTIMHGEKSIPFVPGMPGPQSLLPEPRRRDAKPNLSSLASVQKPSSSSQPLQNVPNDVPKIEISSPPAEDIPGARKFLRPTSLPLKPGSFTPKRLHQGTTPTVLSLVSPETPRPKKSYGQLFLNGHAYTYLGLKCSTRSYYCTISRPQPMYVVQSPQRTRLSMYSNWKVYSETDPLGLTPGQAMAHYDSRYRTGGFTTADSCKSLSSGIVTHSSTWKEGKGEPGTRDPSKSEPERKRQKICSGGYESLEDYTYVRGRGRGRYVCEECGIRCKKPSMLKKHIRTHTDLRPYSCRHCAFAFKTKGNLTKHMKSKAHFKKCAQLNVDPTPPALSDGDSDREDDSGTSETESDDSDEDNDSSAGTDALEREVACSLLSLSSSPRVSQHVAAGLLPRAALDSRPTCYPYTTALLKNAQVQTEMESSFGDEETPIDLSQKERGDSLSFLSKDSEFLQPQPESVDMEPKTPSEVERPVPAYLAASIATHQDSRLVEAPRGHMLQAYLTAKALRDVQLKQQHRSKTPEVAAEQETVVIEGSEGPRLALPVETHEAHSKQQPEVVSRHLIVAEPADGSKRVLVNIPSQPAEGVPDQRVAGALSKTHDANLKAEFFPPASGPNHSYVSVTEDGRSICVICNKTFSKPSQLRLHVNIHYFERPFRCEACAVSFRTKGHLQKHERSVSHHNKVSMNTTFGAATTTNPRPFKCDDCKIAFRIHGHLAKHLRSKMHIMKLECIGKLPFGTYAELERSGFNLNEIDTTDCDNSLESLQALAQKLYEKDSSKFGQPISVGERKVTDDSAADSDSSSSEGLHTEQLQCGVCGEPCDSPAALQVHMFADHNREMVLDKRKPED